MSFKNSVKKFDNFIPEIYDLEKEGFSFVPVGSRVTSKQTFTRDNDYDFLIYLNPNDSNYFDSIAKFRSKGFNGTGDYGPSADFISMKKETTEYIANIIIVQTREHFEDFIFASNIAKDLNLTNKQDRIILFDYITRNVGKFSITYQGNLNDYTEVQPPTNTSYYTGSTLNTASWYEQAFPTTSYIAVTSNSGSQTGRSG